MYGQNDSNHSNQLKAVLIPSTFQCVFNHPDYIVHRPKMTSITKDSKAKVEAKSFAKATFLGSFKNLGLIRDVVWDVSGLRIHIYRF